MHGNSINEETIVALRLVKDHLFKIGGPTKVKITPKLPVSVGNSFQRWSWSKTLVQGENWKRKSPEKSRDWGK